MNGIMILLALALSAAGFCLLPWLALLASRRLWKRGGRLLFLGVALVQAIVCAPIAQHSSISFAEEIPAELGEEKGDWVRETLVGPYGVSTLPGCRIGLPSAAELVTELVKGASFATFHTSPWRQDGADCSLHLQPA